jgi:hypothetical protein
MEFLGRQKAFSFLLSTGMIITTFVSDRHSSIAKWMREECTKLCKEMKKKPKLSITMTVGMLRKVRLY